MIQHCTILHNYQTMAWKNGQGTTRQFIISPPTCTSVNDDFTFRLSSAQMKTQLLSESHLENSCASQMVPFSSFIGYSRVLIYTQCNHLEQNCKSKNPTQMFIIQEEESNNTTVRDYLPMMMPYSFSGSTKTKCELISNNLGTIQEGEHLIIDFNVMTRDERATCEKIVCHSIILESLEINLWDLLNSSPPKQSSFKTNTTMENKWYFFLYVPDDLDALTRVTIPISLSDSSLNSLPEIVQLNRDETLQLDGVGNYSQILSQVKVNFEAIKLQEEKGGRHVIGVLIIEK